MKFGLADKDIDLIISVFTRFQQVEEVLIFGSRAKGNFKPGSDIDLAVKGNELTDELVNSIYQVLENDIPLPYKFDLINFHTISNPAILEHITRVGKIFYQKNLLSPTPKQ